MNTERKVLSLRRDTTGLPQISERLHKVLANAGLGSRRGLEERILAGEVRINGEVAQIGALLNNGDRVEIDGRRFAAVPFSPDETRVLMYHKPEGLVTTNDDPEGRPTVFEKLPRLKGARWVSVGRLDINTTGLLLLTTDGELANALMHPSREVEREYVCRIFGDVKDEHLEQLQRGVELEDGTAAFDEIIAIHRDEKHSWFRVILREGRNREVRRLWEALGFMVSRLKRIRYGIVELPRELRRGHHRALDAEQVRALRHSVGLGDTPQSLTLEPIIGQRRAPARPSNEFRPEPRQQRAWTGTSYEEARELRAFDRPLLDDTLGRRKKRGAPVKKRGAGAGKPGGGKPGGRARGAGGAGAGTGPGNRIERGNRAGAPGQMQQQRRKPRKPKTMTGPMDSNEMLFRTWYPGNEPNGNVMPSRNDVDGNRVAPENRGSAGNGDNRGTAGNADNRGGRGPRPPRRGDGKPPGGRPRPPQNAAPPPATEGEGRQRRGPYGRMRKRGKREDGGGTPPPASDD